MSVEENKVRRSTREWLRIIGLTLLGLLAVAGILWMFLKPNNKADTPYAGYDEQGYTVSIRFDAGDGQFGDNVNTRGVVDTYSLEGLPQSKDGTVYLPVLDPNDGRRVDKFEAKRAKYVLAGWYTKNENGELDKKWNFEEDRLTVNVNDPHSASEPVLTLYAVWLPRFTVEYYNIAKPTEPLHTEECLMGAEFILPGWDTESGKMKRNGFPKEVERKGFTFGQVYYDAERTQPITDDVVVHPGSADASGAAVNPVLKLYIEYIEGDWYHIYDAAQLIDNADATGNYVLMNDLDFTNKIWPSNFSTSTFNGRIEGNGHTIRNVTVVQDQTTNSYAGGLFGTVGNSAVIQDVTFDNVTYRIEKGTIATEPNFGLFTGYLYENATLENVAVTNSQLQVDYDAKLSWSMQSYVIRLFCGVGDATKVPHDITCQAVMTDENGNKVSTNKVVLTVDDDETVTVVFKD